MDLNFRNARLADLETIVQLLADDQLGQKRELSATNPSYQKAFMEITVDKNHYLMVVEREGKVVGTCHLTLLPFLTFQGARRMNVEAVRIDSSSRGQNIGAWMFDQILALARAKQCKIIQLTTNKERIDARRFYEKIGFKATHEGMKIYL